MLFMLCTDAKAMTFLALWMVCVIFLTSLSYYSIVHTFLMIVLLPTHQGRIHSPQFLFPIILRVCLSCAIYQEYVMTLWFTCSDYIKDTCSLHESYAQPCDLPCFCYCIMFQIHLVKFPILVTDLAITLRTFMSFTQRKKISETMRRVLGILTALWSTFSI